MEKREETAEKKTYYPAYTRTPVLCPNCMKKKLMADKDNDAWCDECGEEFHLTGPMSVKFR